MRRINAFLGTNRRLALVFGLGLVAIGLAMLLIIDSPVQYVGLVLVVVGIIIIPTLKEMRGDQQEQEEEIYYQ